MDDNLKEEIETLKAVYNDDELFIDQESETAINVSFSTKLDRYFAVQIKFCIRENKQKISVMNGDDCKKLIPSKILTQIEQLLIDKYNSEGEYMPIFQCISFCTDELLEDESLNLSDQLRNIPFCVQIQGGKASGTTSKRDKEQEMMTYANQCNINKKDYFNINKSEYKHNKQNDFGSYWRDMNKYNKEYEAATIRNIGNDNYHKSEAINDDEKKQNEQDDICMGTWARYSLKQIDINLWNSIPRIPQIRALLKKKNKKIKPENYSIHFIAKYPVIKKFLDNVEFGCFSNYDVVYSHSDDKNVQKVIENGWNFKENNYNHQQSTRFSKFKDINPCCSNVNVFLSIIRVKLEYKNKNEGGSYYYVISNALDIIPIYLLKFHDEKSKNAHL